MDYIDKLFKQHPFIYYIGGKYYAFGVNTCTECNGKSVLLESRYKKFEESLKDDLSDEEAWRIFHKLSCEASSTEERTCVMEKEEFTKFSFGEEDMKELKKQIERYINYWQKHNLNQIPKQK